MDTLSKGDVISCYLEPNSNKIAEMRQGDKVVLSLGERNQEYKGNGIFGWVIVSILMVTAIGFVIYGLKMPLTDESELDKIHQFDQIKLLQEGGKMVLRKKSGIGHFVVHGAILLAPVALYIFFPGIFQIPLAIIVVGVCCITNCVIFISTTFGNITVDTETKEIRIYTPFPYKRSFDEIDRITTFYDNSDSEGAEICRLVIKFKDGKEVKWRTTSNEQSKQLELKLKMLIYPNEYVFR